MKSKIIIILAFILNIFPSLYAHDFEAEGFFFNFTGPETVEVTYKGYLDLDEPEYPSQDTGYNTYYEGDLVIPEKVLCDNNIYAVTSIGNYAFYKCRNLTGLKIPDSVVSIGMGAFYKCYTLSEIEIPSSVT